MQFDVQSVIRRIEIRLAEIGMTKQEFYEKSGISSGSFSQWNTRRTKPRKSKLPAIAEYLGVSVADLLPDEELVPQEGIKKDPIPKDEAVSPAAQEILDFLDSASGEELADVIKYIRYLKSQRGQA